MQFDRIFLASCASKIWFTEDKEFSVKSHHFFDNFGLKPKNFPANHIIMQFDRILLVFQKNGKDVPVKEGL